ncbi:MAG: hypothetical protein ABSD42_10890 [Candidatus Bathyarchaeia archaeon]|jgi:hypothetical protein
MKEALLDSLNVERFENTYKEKWNEDIKSLHYRERAALSRKWLKMVKSHLFGVFR